ncbi:MAG: hypothetical protein ACJ72N_07370 [Labedaea sp.]
MNPPHWTFDQTAEHTRPQLAILAEGRMPSRHRREFGSIAEAERWLESGG